MTSSILSANKNYPYNKLMFADKKTHIHKTLNINVAAAF